MALAWSWMKRISARWHGRLENGSPVRRGPMVNGRVATPTAIDARVARVVPVEVRAAMRARVPVAPATAASGAASRGRVVVPGSSLTR